MSKTLPKVTECKEYIQSCGFKFLRYRYCVYVFLGVRGPLYFSLREMREAFRYGF